ncbi:hypothetical protein [Niabella hibiscisoli]|uniref:hypothetical protein n=1 Tax=Niabella hibiscisoli TaxID=1825928 RepID=UPI001F104FA7|nr:hypothetical protein [Niabella hibiscisoli]MCH5716145.1 hypothetical protein [Niabella hibiscisoli]
MFQVRKSGSEDPTWTFIPVISKSERSTFSYVTDIPKEYKPNPPAQIAYANNVFYCRQPMLAGGDYTTAWIRHREHAEDTYFISVGYNTLQSSLAATIETLSAPLLKNPQGLIDRHRNWWHQYYPLSFVSLPDARMESFYWIQQYKIASATRKTILP